jgi:hypothetical protein
VAQRLLAAVARAQRRRSEIGATNTPALGGGGEREKRETGSKIVCRKYPTTLLINRESLTNNK